MKRLWHSDMVRLLGLCPARDRSSDVAALLDNTRKHSNASYKAVVDGSRPRRTAKADQEIASSMSRQSAAEYWMARIKGDV